MEMRSSVQERPDVSAQERASHELIKRILKLRWIGMEVEAEQMQVALRRVEPRCTLLAGPYDTD
jgi:hypothetical protein